MAIVMDKITQFPIDLCYNNLYGPKLEKDMYFVCKVNYVIYGFQKSRPISTYNAVFDYWML